MAEIKNSETMELETQLKEENKTDNGKTLKIGLVGNYEDTEETRFLLTPEGCGLLTSSGIKVMMESGAAPTSVSATPHIPSSEPTS